MRDLALFNLAIDSKLRACDLTALKVEDVAAGGEVKTRGIIVQKKTGRPVQFEITEQTRATVTKLIHRHYLRSGDYLFPSRLARSPHLSTRQYARIVQGWVSSIGLNPATYRDALAPTNKGGANLSQDRQPTRRAAPARALQA